MRNNDDGCGMALLALIATLLMAIANGFVLFVLWGWFVVPVFAVPSLGVAQAIGFSMVVSFLTHQRQQTGNKDEKSLTERIIEMVLYPIVYPIMVLGIGFIIAQFV